MTQPVPNQPSASTDEALMMSVQAGDEQSYEVLFSRWRQPIFGFLQRRTGSRQAAEEAFQETWLRVYRWRGSYQAPRPFKPWLYRIASNAGHDARRPVVEDFHWIEPAAADTLAMLETVISTLHNLEPAERRLMLLVVEGFTSVEIAEILDLPAGAVRTRINRSRAKLREAFNDPQ